MNSDDGLRQQTLLRLYNETYKHAVRLGAGFDAEMMTIALISTAAALSHRAGMPREVFREIAGDALDRLVNNWGGEQHDD